MTVVVASWNIHSGVGGDARFRPARIAAVIEELDADIVALQEVAARRAGFDMPAYLRHAYRGEISMQTTLSDRYGTFGNAVLTRLPVVSSSAHDISVAGREPRGALEVVVATHAGALRIINTHLGLSGTERVQQVQRLLALVATGTTPTVLLGDFNAWHAHDASMLLLRRHFCTSAAPRTFPALLPMLRLDRLFHDKRINSVSLSSHRSRFARIASDHIPVTARLDFVDQAH